MQTVWQCPRCLMEIHRERIPADYGPTYLRGAELLRCPSCRAYVLASPVIEPGPEAVDIPVEETDES